MLDLLEARERVNRDLKRQDERVRVAGERVADLVTVRNELFATWRLVNNELAAAAAAVWPEEGLTVPPVYDAEVDVDMDADIEPMEGNEVPEPWDG